MGEPKHMDVASRNQRLRKTLEGMGLYVRPIFKDGGGSEIDCLVVSVALPAHSVPQGVAEKPAGQVRDGITSTKSDGSNVINLPPMV